MENKVALCPNCGEQLSPNGSHNGIKEYKCKNINCSKKYVYKPIWKEYKNEKSELIIDKKQSEFDFKEWTKLIMQKQELHEKAGNSQKSVNPIIKTKLDNIIVLFLSDLHLGSLGTDYKTFLEFTDFILKPNVYVILVGDMADNFVNFKNKLAMHQQVISPREQDMFIEAWIKEIAHKVLGAFWGNHEEFEEKVSGKNTIKNILAHYVPYVNGIGKINLQINNQKYGIVATHKTRFFSNLNTLHGLKRLAQMDIPNEDIYVAGDRHVPGLEIAFQRGLDQVYIQLGTLKIDDAYTHRYFSHVTNATMPCVVLNTQEHSVIPFWKIGNAIKYCNALEVSKTA